MASSNPGKLLSFSLLVALLLVFPSQANASYYNEEYYSYCVYNWIDECPEIVNSGKGVGEKDTGPDSISADIDDDGNQELAIDENQDMNDGYEVFEDPDGSSRLFASLDGDGDGQIGFLIITENGQQPGVYWDPDDGVLSEVTTADPDEDGTLEFLFDSDGDGTIDAYWDPDDRKVYRIAINSVRRDIDRDNNGEVALNNDLDDSNGFEVFEDADGSSRVYEYIDGDFDGRTDFLITIEAEGLPDIYWDPDRNVLSVIALLNVDDDPSMEFLFDSDDDGVVDKYYDRETSTVYEYSPPSETRFTPDGFGGPIYRGLGNWLKSLPSFVTSALPLFSLWLLGMLAGLFLLQARQEMRRVESLKMFLERQKTIAEEKKTFIQLISHYLRTPLTSISGYSELVLSDENRGLHQPARQVIEKTKGMQAMAETLISRANESTSGTVAGQVDSVDEKTLKRQKVMVALPLVLFGITVLVIQFALADFRLIDISVWALTLLMALTAVTLVVSLVLMRRRSLRALERKHRMAEVEAEEKIDDAVNSFVNDAASSIGASLDDLRAAASQLAGHKDYQKIDESIGNLEETTGKFAMLSNLTLSKLRHPKTELFSSYEPINQALQNYSRQIQDKQLKVNADPVEFPSIDQDRRLVSYVFSTILDNAVAYSPDGGQIDIHTGLNDAHDTVAVSFQDNGPGIPAGKQDLLFKPFSRTEGAEDFTHQGLGLNLYLDRLITRYLGGDISLESKPDQGTQVNVMLPIAL